jgi:hypothetical protein
VRLETVVTAGQVDRTFTCGACRNAWHLSETTRRDHEGVEAARAPGAPLVAGRDEEQPSL